MALNDGFDNISFYLRHLSDLLDELRKDDYDKRYRHNSDTEIIEMLLREKIEELKK